MCSRQVIDLKSRLFLAQAGFFASIGYGGVYQVTIFDSLHRVIFENKIEAETKEQAEELVRSDLLHKYQVAHLKPPEFSICPVDVLAPDKPFRIKVYDENSVLVHEQIIFEQSYEAAHAVAANYVSSSFGAGITSPDIS